MIRERSAQRSPIQAPGLFDSHAHLDAPDFDVDRAQALYAARTAGVTQILIPAVAAAAWPALRALCESETGLYPAYGLHPCYLSKHVDADLGALDAWLTRHRAFAVGECGLDDGEPDHARQLVLLNGQMEIARRHDLPMVLHARHAFEDVILALQRFGKPLRGVVHSFSGSVEQARQLWRLGFYVGIGGPVTHDRAKRLRRTVEALPLETLLLETDSPDQPGARHRGQRNEPAFLIDVLDCVAALRGTDPATVARETTRNAERLFLQRNG